MGAQRSKTHNVYVVELDKAVLGNKKFLEANPILDPEMACFYVGMTGLDPDERFQNHKAGVKACRLVKKYGLYLRRKKYEKYNPMTYDDAVAMEVELAEKLRKKGHGVWQK